MNDYQTGLCGCFSDCGSCLFTLCCLPCSLGDNWAKSRDEDCGICHVVSPVYPMWTRANIRKKMGQQEYFCEDCMTYVCYFYCAACQDARQLKLMEEGNEPKRQPITMDTIPESQQNRNIRMNNSQMNEPMLNDQNNGCNYDRPAPPQFNQPPPPAYPQQPPNYSQQQLPRFNHFQ